METDSKNGVGHIQYNQGILKKELFQGEENINQKTQGNYIKYWLSEMEWPKKKDKLVPESPKILSKEPLLPKDPECVLSFLLFLYSQLNKLSL